MEKLQHKFIQVFKFYIIVPLTSKFTLTHEPEASSSQATHTRLSAHRVQYMHSRSRAHVELLRFAHSHSCCELGLL